MNNRLAVNPSSNVNIILLYGYYQKIISMPKQIKYGVLQYLNKRNETNLVAPCQTLFASFSSSFNISLFYVVLIFFLNVENLKDGLEGRT